MRSLRSIRVSKAQFSLQRALAVAGLVLFGLTLLTPVAHARPVQARPTQAQGELQVFGDRTKQFDTVLDVQVSGDLLVTETITQDLQEANRRHRAVHPEARKISSAGPPRVVSTTRFNIRPRSTFEALRSKCVRHTILPKRSKCLRHFAQLIDNAS
jgi:hypothetical protein